MDFKKQVKQVADKYREEGYRVTLHPRGKRVPSFAVPYEPDFIASKGDQNILVQVKRDRFDLSRDQSLSRLAEVTDAQPGWRFDLVILEPVTPLEEAARRAKEPSVEQIQQLLANSERSAEAGDALAAFIIAWSGLEAAMRYKMRAAGLDGDRPTAPTVLIRNLYSSGFLSVDELRQLDVASLVRNEVVHGFVPPKPKAASVHYLVSVARRLLKDNRKR